MEVQVPQFVQHKGKILGPLGVGEFAVLAFVILIIFILSRILPTTLVWAIGFIMVAIAVWLLFGKIEGRPVTDMLKNLFMFSMNPSKFYIWQKKPIFRKIKGKQEFRKKTKEGAPSKILGEKELEKLNSEIESKNRNPFTPQTEP